MQGLQPQAMQALPSSSLPALTPQQISKMSYHAAKSILPIQQNGLTSAQLEALHGVIDATAELDAGSADDTARPEETRALPSDVVGRAKGGQDDHVINPANPTTPPTSATTEGPTSTTAPESEGETAPKSGSNRNHFMDSTTTQVIVILSTIVNLYRHL